MAFALWKAFQKERVFLFAVVLLADLEKTIHSNTKEKPESLRLFIANGQMQKDVFTRPFACLYACYKSNLSGLGFFKYECQKCLLFSQKNPIFKN